MLRVIRSDGPVARKLSASIEIQPKQATAADGLVDLIPRGCRVYIADTGAEPLDSFVVAVRRVSDLGFAAVPHIPARRMTTRAALETRIGRFAEEGGASDVLVIGGGASKPAGEFGSTMDVLKTGLLDRFGIRRIGVAGHPEGSPDFDESVGIQALADKQAYAGRTDADMRIVTQFGFDAERIVTWADGMKAKGIDLPVHLGLAGPAKMTTIIKFAIMCGVGPSLEFLRKKSSLLTSLTSGYSPGDITDRIDQHVARTPDSAIRQLHVFPFGGIKTSSDFLMSAGYWSDADRHRSSR